MTLRPGHAEGASADTAPLRSPTGVGSTDSLQDSLNLPTDHPHSRGEHVHRDATASSLPAATPDGQWVMAEESLSPKLGGGMRTLYWMGPSGTPIQRRTWQTDLAHAGRFATAEDAIAALAREMGEDDVRRFRRGAQPRFVGEPETLF